MFTFQGPGGCRGVVNMATFPRTRWVWRCGEHGYFANRVRTRAITGFAQCLESGGVSIKKTIKEMITPRTNIPLPPRLVPTPTDNVRTVQHAGIFFIYFLARVILDYNSHVLAKHYELLAPGRRFHVPKSNTVNLNK